MISIYDYIIFRDDEETLLDLPETAYRTLIAEGRAAHAWGDPLHLPYLCLVYSEDDEDIGEGVFGYEPVKGLGALLDRAYLARPALAPPHDLELAQPGPLRVMLNQHLPPLPPPTQRAAYREIFLQLFDPSLRGLFDQVDQEVGEHGRYLGAMSKCTCGEPACGAACGWIERYTGILYVDSGSGLIIVRAYLPGL